MTELIFEIDISDDLYQKNQVVPTDTIPSAYSVANSAWQAALAAAVTNFDTALQVLNPALAPLFAGTRVVTPLLANSGYTYPSVLSEDPTGFLNALRRTATGATGQQPTYSSITFYIMSVQNSNKNNGFSVSQNTETLIAVFYYLT